LPAYDAGVLTASREMADYYEEVVKAGADAKAASNWMMGEVSRELNDAGTEIDAFAMTPKALAGLIALQGGGKVSSSAAKTIFVEMLKKSGETADAVMRRLGLEQVSDNTAIEQEAAAVLDAHPDEVARYLAGKEQLLQFFVGQLMKRTRGKANPQVATDLIKALLDKRR
jgi:aspartyl-tRNA(Asn)/glutamyl-tRNA(Gln) amidotransferase subunit B